MIFLRVAIFFVVAQFVASGYMIDFVDNSPRSHSTQNWFDFHGKTYYIETIFKGNFFQAMQSCRQRGMHLLSFSSKDENDAILEYLTAQGFSTNDHFWTSGTKLVDRNLQQWVWLSTGSRILQTKWAKGEPSNKNKDEHCIELKYFNNQEFFWNDENCFTQLYFICEKEKSILPDPIPRFED